MIKSWTFAALAGALAIAACQKAAPQEPRIFAGRARRRAGRPDAQSATARRPTRGASPVR